MLIAYAKLIKILLGAPAKQQQIPGLMLLAHAVQIK
jgi:hypothetical protein